VLTSLLVGWIVAGRLLPLISAMWTPPYGIWSI